MLGLQALGRPTRVRNVAPIRWSEHRALDIARIADATARRLGLDDAPRPRRGRQHRRAHRRALRPRHRRLPRGPQARRRHRGPDPRPGLQRQGHGRPDRRRPPGPAATRRAGRVPPHGRHAGAVRVRGGFGAGVIPLLVVPRLERGTYQTGMSRRAPLDSVGAPVKPGHDRRRNRRDQPNSACPDASRPLLSSERSPGRYVAQGMDQKARVLFQIRFGQRGARAKPLIFRRPVGRWAASAGTVRPIGLSRFAAVVP